MSTETNNNGDSLFSESSGNGPFVVNKQDLNVEIDSQVTKKIKEVTTYIVSLILAVVFGGIVSSLWIVNGEVRELKGKYTSPDNMLEIMNKRLEKIEQENKTLSIKVQQSEINKLKVEISELKSAKNAK